MSDELTVKQNFNEKDYENYSRQDLLDKIKSLSAHNNQLKNILVKNKEIKSSQNSKPFDFSKYSFRHIALNILYFGWDYDGYVVQEDTKETIEHHLFEALLKTKLIKDRASSNYHRCGRTDRGVSSFGQVVSLTVRSNLNKNSVEIKNEVEGEIEYCKILNRVLPDDIQCVAWSPVAEEFSARFACNSRTYKYYFPKGHLNIENMNIALNKVLGAHDFRNFCKMDVGNGVTKFIRNIYKVSIYPLSDKIDEHTIFAITIKAKAFLWHQIRCILGIIFLIGQNKEDPSIIDELLNVVQNPRKPDYVMANEVPLNLFHCEYDDKHISWKYDNESLEKVINNLSSKWSFLAIKQTMVKDMIDHLKDTLAQQGGSLTRCLSYNLVPVFRKNYVPVMKRQKCNSLEDKMKHFAKRKKIDETDATV